MADPAVPFSWRCERAKAGSGALGDLGSHAISVARFLGGPIVEVLGDTAMVVPERAVAPPGGDLQFGRVEQPSELRKVENEDIAHGLFRFASGVLGSLDQQPHRLGPQERPRPRALRHAGRGPLPPGALQRVRAVPAARPPGRQRLPHRVLRALPRRVRPVHARTRPRDRLQRPQGDRGGRPAGRDRHRHAARPRLPRGLGDRGGVRRHAGERGSGAPGSSRAAAVEPVGWRPVTRASHVGRCRRRACGGPRRSARRARRC